MWFTEADIDTARIDPGKPSQNVSSPSSNGMFRDECLSTQRFKKQIHSRGL